MWVEVLAVVVTLVVAALGYTKYKHSFWSSRGVPTAPNGLPFIGHMKGFMKSKGWLYIDELYREHGGDKILGTYIMQNPRLMLGDPELVKAILVKDFDHFVDRSKIKFTTEEDDFFNELLTTASGDHWKGIRSVLSPSFTSGRLKNMFPLVESKADELVAYITKQTKSNPKLNIKSTFGLYTIEVIASCAFGIETNTLQNGDSRFKQNAEDMSKLSTLRLLKFFAFMLMPRLFKLFKIPLSTPEHQFLKEVVEETLKRREEGEKRGDFLDLMMEAREDQKNPTARTPKYKLENKTVVANSFLFISAGYDTTTTTLSHVTCQLARHKHYQDTVREELKQIIEENGSLTYQGLMEAKMLEAVIQETLRMNPPVVATERLCTKEYSFSDPGLTIDSNVTVFVPIWSLHHDPRYWDAPGTFVAERFLPHNKDKIISGTFLPFGLGPRNCIGIRFALMEVKVAVAKVLLSFQMSCVPGEELTYDLTPGLMKPAPHTRLVFTPLEE